MPAETMRLSTHSEGLRDLPGKARLSSEISLARVSPAAVAPPPGHIMHLFRAVSMFSPSSSSPPGKPSLPSNLEKASGQDETKMKAAGQDEAKMKVPEVHIDQGSVRQLAPQLVICPENTEFQLIYISNL